jgi:hypothetical protein
MHVAEAVHREVILEMHVVVAGEILPSTVVMPVHLTMVMALKW